MKGVQCYELFGGISLKNHAFFYAVIMGGGRPLSNFDEMLSMAILTASWWMLLMTDL